MQVPDVHIFIVNTSPMQARSIILEVSRDRLLYFITPDAVYFQIY